MDPKIANLTPINGASPEDVVEALAGITGIRRVRVEGKKVVVESTGNIVPKS